MVVNIWKRSSNVVKVIMTSTRCSDWITEVSTVHTLRVIFDFQNTKHLKNEECYTCIINILITDQGFF